MRSFERFSAPYSPYYGSVGRGAGTQRGAGRLKKLWRKKIKPVLRKTGARALKHGLKLGARVASDIVLKRKAPGKALKSRVRQTLAEIQK